MTAETPTPTEAGSDVVALVNRAAALLSEIYDPAGVLIFWSNSIRYLDGKRPCDLYRDRDIGGLERLCRNLDSIADGNF